MEVINCRDLRGGSVVEVPATVVVVPATDVVVPALPG